MSRSPRQQRQSFRHIVMPHPFLSTSKPHNMADLMQAELGSEAQPPACTAGPPGLHKRETPPVQGTIAEGAPVVPISAQLKYNIDAVCEYIVKKIPVPVRCAFGFDSLALTACTCGIAPQPSPAMRHAVPCASLDVCGNGNAPACQGMMSARNVSAC